MMQKSPETRSLRLFNKKILSMVVYIQARNSITKSFLTSLSLSFSFHDKLDYFCKRVRFLLKPYITKETVLNLNSALVDANFVIFTIKKPKISEQFIFSKVFLITLCILWEYVELKLFNLTLI